MLYPITCIEQRPGDLFWNLPRAPDRIFVQGSPGALNLLQSLPEKGFAIVGTRNPQERSLGLVEKTLQQLSSSGLIILSGFARGIDTAAHRAALKAGLPTIAVLGTELSKVYPRENFSLRQEILQSGGLILSEFPPGTPTRDYHFLLRNRLIAGGSKATWVVEAGLRSGALNTARWARELDRPCFAVPCFPGDPALAGNQTLLDRDHALPFWDASSLGAVWLELASLPLTPRKARSQPRSSPHSFGLEAATLLDRIRKATGQMGGISNQDLFNWATDLGWTPQIFFLALQELATQKAIHEGKGTWASF